MSTASTDGSLLRPDDAQSGANSTTGPTTPPPPSPTPSNTSVRTYDSSQLRWGTEGDKYERNGEGMFVKDMGDRKVLHTDPLPEGSFGNTPGDSGSGKSGLSQSEAGRSPGSVVDTGTQCLEPQGHKVTNSSAAE